MKTSGLDVHKDKTFCAIFDGKSYSEVKEFSTTTDSIQSLGEYLRLGKVKLVPSPLIQELRSYTREYRLLVQQLSIR